MKSKKIVVVISALLVLLSSQAFCSGPISDKVADFASGSLSRFVVGGELALMADGRNGKTEALQGAKALAATTLAVEGLKYLVREKRPNSESLTSFPSGHTAEAFAMATVWSNYHPKYGWLAYGGAALVGWSRVHEGEHYWRDVAAGALLGHFIAQKFTSGNYGLNPDGSIGYHSRF